MTMLGIALAVVSTVMLGLRGQMLKPELASWPDSPRCVGWASSGLSLASALWAVGAWLNGWPVTGGSIPLLGSLAIYSTLMFVNLYRQERAAGGGE